MPGDELTHLDADGKVRMVDISSKDVTERLASAEGVVRMRPETLRLALGGEIRKGDVIATAEIAGVMAAKRTADLVPLCHPLPLSGVQVRVDRMDDDSGLRVRADVKTTGRTGVEMEALTAVSVACLTLYDMLKAVEKAMVISDIRLLSKSGGASGDYVA